MIDRAEIFRVGAFFEGGQGDFGAGGERKRPVVAVDFGEDDVGRDGEIMDGGAVMGFFHEVGPPGKYLGGGGEVFAHRGEIVVAHPGAAGQIRSKAHKP